MVSRDNDQNNKVSLASTLLALNLATFSFGQEPVSAPSANQNSATLTEDVNIAPDHVEVRSPATDLETESLPQLFEIVDPGLSKEAPSSIVSPESRATGFESFSRERYDQTVLRAREDTEFGAEIYHYRFKLKFGDDDPRSVFSGVPVIVGWIHSGDDLEGIERHLSNKGFIVFDVPLDEVLPPARNADDELDKAAIPGWVKTIAIPVTVCTLLVVGHLTFSRIMTSIRNRRSSRPDSDTPELENDKVTDEPGVKVNEIESFQILPGLQKALSIELKPKQRITAESGAMMHFQPGIDLRTVTGRSIGFTPVPLGPVGRVLAGESFFFQTFKNTSDKNLNVTLTPSAVGNFLHLDLSEYPGGIYADNGAFFAASPSVQLSIVKKAGLRGAITGIGIFQQHLTGSGDVFLHTHGELHEIDITDGSTVVVDTKCIFAWEPTVKLQLKSMGIISGWASGEGLYLCELSGVGKVWMSTSGGAGSSNGTGGTFAAIGRALDRVF